MTKRIPMRLTKSKYLSILIAVPSLFVFGAIIIREYVKQPPNSILYLLYKRETPSIVDKFFRYVPEDYYRYIKIRTEQFHHGKIICLEDKRFGFSVYKLFLQKENENEDLIDFNGGQLVSDNFLMKFDINAFNFYILNKYKNLTSALLYHELLLVLNHKCGEKEFYYIDKKEDLINILRLYPPFKKQEYNNNLLPDSSQKCLIWSKRIGLIKILVSFNPNYTLKAINFSKIGVLGNEMLNM
jgi:hypothetical protein